MGAVRRYDVVDAFARGGMAELSIARAHGSGHLSIVKRMRADADNRRTRRMFRDEIRITASMCHPNVVEVRDCDTTTGDDYLVMEYVHGRDLRKILAHAAREDLHVPLDVAISIIAEAAAGLHHAHELRGVDGLPFAIVHRDVSPPNILVGFDGRVLLIDFGIAKASFTREEAGSIKGKPSYMAPEQCLDRPVDRRTDVFALGIVLYELVTARRLFHTGDELSTMQSIAHGHIPSPSARRAEIAPALEAVILRALEHRPEARFQTAGEFREALLACLARPVDTAAIATFMCARFDPSEAVASLSEAPRRSR